MSESAKDSVLAAVLIALGVGALVVLAHTRSGGTSGADVIGFASLPRLYAILLIGLGGLLAISSVTKLLGEARGRLQARRIRSALANPTILLRTIGTVVLLILYVLGLQKFVFFPVTALFLAAMFFLYGRGPIWAVILVAIVGAGTLDVLFIRIIDLPLH